MTSCLPEQLEQRLRDGGFPAVEVVNAGVLSYCPLLEYLQYRHTCTSWSRTWSS